jgi:hypothetical protein
MKEQLVQGFWGNRMPLWGRNDPDSIRRTVSSTRAANSCRCSSVPANIPCSSLIRGLSPFSWRNLLS